MRGITSGLYLNQQQSAAGSLSGRVYDKKGNPLPDVSVSISGGFLYTSTDTDSSGHYTFTDLEPIEYKIMFYKPGYWIEIIHKTIVIGSNSLDIVLTPNTEMAPKKKRLILLGVTVGGLAVVAALVKGIRSTSWTREISSN